MAERKVAIKRAPDRPELQALFEQAKLVTLTNEQLQQQQASFVYGNAPKGSRITKESAAKSVNQIRVSGVVV